MTLDLFYYSFYMCYNDNLLWFLMFFFIIFEHFSLIFGMNSNVFSKVCDLLSNQINSCWSIFHSVQKSSCKTVCKSNVSVNVLDIETSRILYKWFDFFVQMSWTFMASALLQGSLHQVASTINSMQRMTMPTLSRMKTLEENGLQWMDVTSVDDIYSCMTSL